MLCVVRCELLFGVVGCGLWWRLFFVVRRVLFGLCVVCCCLLIIILCCLFIHDCCLLCVVCCSLFLVCGELCSVNRVLFVDWRWLYVVRCLLLGVGLCVLLIWVDR